MLLAHAPLLSSSSSMSERGRCVAQLFASASAGTCRSHIKSVKVCIALGKAGPVLLERGATRLCLVRFPSAVTRTGVGGGGG